MALDDVGANPERLAQALLNQIGTGTGAVPVREIAKAVDIVEIRFEALSSIEGALITTPARGEGSILVNTGSGHRRGRFTIAHELGHYLNLYHAASSAEGFTCTKADLKTRYAAGADRHRRQEAEANTFAIELLAPRERIKDYLAGDPDLAQVLLLADAMRISREAAARRYVELHDSAIAVAFSRHGRFAYAAPGPEFPPLVLVKSGQMPDFCSRADGVIELDDADPTDWLKDGQGFELTVQTLHQQEGWATTLLRVAPVDDEDGADDEPWRR